VLVVGAGLAGLASAVSAALSGHRVTVVESAKELLEVCHLLRCVRGQDFDQPIDTVSIAGWCWSTDNAQRHPDLAYLECFGEPLEIWR
jgi:monoamine oxidase